MAVKKLGIVNLTLVLTAVGASASVVGAVMADGEVTLGDIKHLRDGLRAINQFKNVTWAEVLPEAKDLDDQETSELSVVFNRIFVLPAHLKTAEEMVEVGLSYLLQVLTAVGVFLPESVGGAAKVPLRALQPAS